MKHCKITEQAYQALPNIVTEQIVIETKTSARMIPVTADKDSIDEINRALERAKKDEELLGLYRLKDIHGRTIGADKEYLKICNEIVFKEKELEEMK